MAKRTRPQKKVIDPELKQALEQAPADSTVQATFTLTTPAGEPYRDRASTQAAVKDLIDKASTAAAAPPNRVSVFPNVQSFAVAGSPAFVREIIKHEDVASAMSNVQKKEIFIRPDETPKPQRRTAPAKKKKKQR
jgi:hypothetical protein